jgi:hypothetical protein
MDQLSIPERRWSDTQLKDAVATATNWRDVVRALGLRANSAGTIRILKRHVAHLGLDTSHFRGKRSWSDAQLRHAVIHAQSWDELLTTLGLAVRSGDGRIRVKAHAMRLGLDIGLVARDYDRDGLGAAHGYAPTAAGLGLEGRAAGDGGACPGSPGLRGIWY